MPVHEGAAWISATLESLVAEPTQGLEIIVVDSSPTGATAEIVKQFVGRLPLQLCERQDLGPWQAKTNFGVEIASGDHACILHQDDLWLPGRVKAIRRWIEKSPESALHLSPTLIIDRHGRKMGRWSCPLPAGELLEPEHLLERLLVQNFVSVPAPIFQRSAWLACGAMDEALWYTPDWDVWAKLAIKGPVMYHDEITTAFRIHGSSLTVTGSRDAVEFRAQMETVLNRYLKLIPAGNRESVERLARVSIEVNVSLAAASGGNAAALRRALREVLSLGPFGMYRYFRNSRLVERVGARLRAKLAGGF